MYVSADLKKFVCAQIRWVEVVESAVVTEGLDVRGWHAGIVSKDAEERKSGGG